MSFVYIWEYSVTRDNRAAFARLYGRGGAWVRLFRRADGYVGTTLLADAADATSFVTIDEWRTRESWEAFRREFEREFDDLDVVGEALTESERLIGLFETVA